MEEHFLCMGIAKKASTQRLEPVEPAACLHQAAPCLRSHFYEDTATVSLSSAVTPSNPIKSKNIVSGSVLHIADCKSFGLFLTMSQLLYSTFCSKHELNSSRVDIQLSLPSNWHICKRMSLFTNSVRCLEHFILNVFLYFIARWDYKSSKFFWATDAYIHYSNDMQITFQSILHFLKDLSYMSYTL